MGLMQRRINIFLIKKNIFYIRTMSNNIMKYVVPVRKYVPRYVSKRRVVKRKPRYVRKRPTYRRSNRPYTKISRMPVAERLFTKLRYSEVLTTQTTLANSLYPYLFQTSIFDPDSSGGGHQPLWRDQLATLYNKYRVFGIKYKITWKNTQINQLAIAYVKHSDNSTTETNFNTLSERNEGKTIAMDAAQGRCNYASGYLSIPKAYGISKREFYDDDGFIATSMGVNPAKMAYLHIYIMSLLANAIFNMIVELTYYVEFMDRVDIAGS